MKGKILGSWRREAPVRVRAPDGGTGFGLKTSGSFQPESFFPAAATGEKGLSLDLGLLFLI